MVTENKTLKVMGERKMNCSGCESSVKFALTQLPGIQEVEVNHQTQLIKLIFDPQVLDLEQMRQELDWIGYQVTQVEED